MSAKSVIFDFYRTDIEDTVGVLKMIPADKRADFADSLVANITKDAYAASLFHHLIRGCVLISVVDPADHAVSDLVNRCIDDLVSYLAEAQKAIRPAIEPGQAA